MKDPNDSYYKVHWRMELIQAALTGLCANTDYHNTRDIARDAVDIADKVIERLEAEAKSRPRRKGWSLKEEVKP